MWNVGSTIHRKFNHGRYGYFMYENCSKSWQFVRTQDDKIHRNAGTQVLIGETARVGTLEIRTNQ